jgi:hypothetical protein
MSPATYKVSIVNGESIELPTLAVSPGTPLSDLLGFLFRAGRQHGIVVTQTIEVDQQPPKAHLTTDAEAIRRSLEAYRQLAAELPELMRAARRPEVDIPIAEIARLAGVDRGRVHRAIRSADGPASVEAHGVVLRFDPVGKSKFPNLVGYAHDERDRRVASVWERSQSPRFYAVVTTGPGASTVKHQGDGESIEASLQALAEQIAAAEADAPEVTRPAADVPHRRGCILPSRHSGECSPKPRRAQCGDVSLTFIDERFRYGWDLGQRRLGPISRDGVDIGWLLLHGMTTDGPFEARTADVAARGDSEQEALQALAERIAGAE